MIKWCGRNSPNYLIRAFLTEKIMGKFLLFEIQNGAWTWSLKNCIYFLGFGTLKLTKLSNKFHNGTTIQLYKMSALTKMLLDTPPVTSHVPSIHRRHSCFAPSRAMTNCNLKRNLRTCVVAETLVWANVCLYMVIWKFSEHVRKPLLR